MRRGAEATDAKGNQVSASPKPQGKKANGMIAPDSNTLTASRICIRAYTLCSKKTSKLAKIKSNATPIRTPNRRLTMNRPPDVGFAGRGLMSKNGAMQNKGSEKRIRLGMRSPNISAMN